MTQEEVTALAQPIFEGCEVDLELKVGSTLQRQDRVLHWLDLPDSQVGIGPAWPHLALCSRQW